MASQSAVGIYTLYSADAAAANAATFGVFAGSTSDENKDVNSLGAICKPLGSATNTPSSTASAIPSSTTSVAPSLSTSAGPSLTTSATPSATPSMIPLDYQGCFTDSADNRALAPAELKDDEMTIELCAAFCSPYKFFGLEYGRECCRSPNLSQLPSIF